MAVSRSLVSSSSTISTAMCRVSEVMVLGFAFGTSRDRTEPASVVEAEPGDVACLRWRISEAD